MDGQFRAPPGPPRFPYTPAVPPAALPCLPRSPPPAGFGAPLQARARDTSPRERAGGSGRRCGAQCILGSQRARKWGRAQPSTSYVTGRGRSLDGGGCPRHFRLPLPAGGAGPKSIGHRRPRGAPPLDADAAILGAGSRARNRTQERLGCRRWGWGRASGGASASGWRGSESQRKVRDPSGPGRTLNCPSLAGVDAGGAVRLVAGRLGFFGRAQLSVPAQTRRLTALQFPANTSLVWVWGLSFSIPSGWRVVKPGKRDRRIDSGWRAAPPRPAPDVGRQPESSFRRQAVKAVAV